MKKTIQSKNLQGVTLIEMMVVISVIVIVTSIMLITYSSTRGSNKLRVAQREVAATIRLAHSYALQGRVQGGDAPCGYGFHFKNKTEYEIFYNNAPTGINCVDFNKSRENLKYINGESDPASGDKYSLVSGVELNEQDPNKIIKSVYFAVPHGGVYDDGGSKLTGNSAMKYELKSVINDEKAAIIIQPGGRVTEESM